MRVNNSSTKSFKPRSNFGIEQFNGLKLTRAEIAKLETVTHQIIVGETAKGMTSFSKS
jgi:hypothetical protein